MRFNFLLPVLFLGHAIIAQVDIQEFEIEEDKERLIESVAIKTDFAMMLMGEIPLITEVQLGRDHGIELGIDYNYNYRISPLRNGLTGGGFYENSSTWVPTYGYMLGYRYYFNGRRVESGSFIGALYKYKKLRRNYDEPLENYPDPQVTDTYHILAVAFGKNYLLGDRFLMELFLSLGYRHALIVRYESVEFGSSEIERVERTPDVTEDRVMPFYLQFGFRLGVFPYK